MGPPPGDPPGPGPPPPQRAVWPWERVSSAARAQRAPRRFAHIFIIKEATSCARSAQLRARVARGIFCAKRKKKSERAPRAERAERAGRARIKAQKMRTVLTIIPSNFQSI